MGRAPCCEKTGLNKGPWTTQEDQILISYIRQHGHSNWRALPKHAGLLRCGKSCRLRWVNYLNPDIKRGQFTLEEEQAIINLHQMLGNRWSAIAANLPGRTDNEIKNVWNTHLKKRLTSDIQEKPKKKIKRTKPSPKNEEQNGDQINYFPAGSPQQSTEISTITEDSSSMQESFPEIDESFWTENLSVTDNFEMGLTENVDQPESYKDGLDEEMDFWFNVFIQAGGSQDLPEF